MTESFELYRCLDCGGIIEIVRPGAFVLCCGKPMKKIKSNRESGEGKQHLPKMTIHERQVDLTFGDNGHPMDATHRIDWIELLGAKTSFRRYFQPGEQPQMTSLMDEDKFSVRVFCTMHGLHEITYHN